MRRKETLVTAVAAGMLLVAGDLRAADQVRRSFTIPATFARMITATECSAAPGPQVTVQGSLTLSGLTAEVIFTDPSGGPAQQEKTLVSQEVVPASHPVGMPEQSVRGAVRDNPYIWLQLTDHNGRPLTSEIFLGRCDQAQFSPTASLQVPVTAFAEVSTSACESSSGPVVTLDGQTELLPINGKLIFRNTDALTGPQRTIEEGTVALAMLPTGQTYSFPQQEVSGAIGGNPLISIQFRQGDGEAIGSEISLGRCVARVQ